MTRALQRPLRFVTALVAFEARMMAAMLRAVFRRPIATRDALPGEAFGVLETSSYRLVAAVLVGLSIVEVGALDVLLRALLGSGHAGVHVALLAANLSTIVWIVGDARALAETRHVVGAETLWLRLGLRAAADIPRAAIVFAGPAAALRPAQAKRAVRVTPLDEPNVALSLARSITIAARLGRVRRARHLLLYVDRPDAFLRAVADSR